MNLAELIAWSSALLAGSTFLFLTYGRINLIMLILGTIMSGFVALAICCYFLRRIYFQKNNSEQRRGDDDGEIPPT